MKINKNGWGLKEMLIMIGILFIFLLFVTYYIFALYNQLDLTKSQAYGELELKLQNAAIKYHKKNSSDNKITVDELKNDEYLVTFVDSNGNSCDGYVIVDGTDYTPYIKCEYYTTKGY